MRELQTIQRWLQSVIMHPRGVVEGLSSAEARAQVDQAVDQVVTRSAVLTAPERLAIYSSAYYARLLECLREEFPVLVYALTEEVFDAFAVAYLQKYPSRSYTLSHLGRDFPRYLAETRPPAADGDASLASWSDFLVDLASLEWTFSEVFDGPGVEGEKLLDPDQLQALSPEEWPAVRLIPVPCLRLLKLRYPVERYFAAARSKQDPAPPQPVETLLAITRRNYVVQHYQLSRPEYEILSTLIAGESVGQAIELVMTTAASEVEGLSEKLRDWFRSWAVRGFFRATGIATDGRG
jgi:hypothetical protein